MDCTKLTSIPTNLYKNNKKASTFAYVFSGCSSLKCDDINKAAENWSRWNADEVNITNVANGCKK